MKRTGVVTRFFMLLAVLGCGQLDTASAAEATHQQASGPVDVALFDGGVLHGRVMDSEGAALARTPVSLWDQNQQVFATTTDENGRFLMHGLHGGVYQLVAAGNRDIVRLWTPGTAPPMCRQDALLMVRGFTVRGQHDGPFGGHLHHWYKNPWIVGGLIATAVAVPVAIHNSRRPTSP